ncbi:MAG: NAD(P)-binding domain-containing protein, partial [Gemmatimonadota bacterium]|nr:NAD(P)-binding domain-containing protein [Gemmatimonadota bacterium]
MKGGRAPGALDPIVIWGAGAMGGSIGAWLIRSGHEVLFVDADEEHAAAIRENGLRIEGPVDSFSVEAYCADPRWVDPGLRTVLLCVKGHHTRAAMKTIGPLLHPEGFVVSVQNGLNELDIADVVGARRTVGCFVNFGADVTSPGVVLRGNRGAVVVGELDGSRTVRVRAL